VTRPRIARPRVDACRDLVDERPVADVAQESTADRAWHRPPLLRGDQDAATDGFGSAVDLAKRCRQPGLRDLRIGIRRRDDATWPPDGQQSSARFVHRDPSRGPDVRLARRQFDLDDVQRQGSKPGGQPACNGRRLVAAVVGEQDDLVGVGSEGPAVQAPLTGQRFERALDRVRLVTRRDDDAGGASGAGRDGDARGCVWSQWHVWRRAP
jgi:hypothetical protein